MNKYQIVIAGCGGISNHWFDFAASRDDAEIVGLVDIAVEHARAMAGRRGLDVPIYTDIRQALAETGANVVFDATVPSSHKQIVAAALEAGCHIFGEKPMAESMADARELLKLSQQAGRRYAIMQNRRYLKHIRDLRHFVADGGIGSLGSLHADFFIGAHFGGFRDAMDSPLIVDMAIHTFDQARFISGANPVSVYCHEYNPRGSWYNGNASTVCIFEMSDGSVFSYRGSWCAEGFRTSWESDWRVIGSKGTVRWDGDNRPVCELADGQEAFMRAVKRVDVPERWSGREGHPGCLDEMFAALADNRRAETEASDNIHSMAMVFGAIESARTGRKVKLSDL